MAPPRALSQVVDLPHRAAGPFSYDEEWLGIVRAAHATMPLTRSPAPLPGGGRAPPPGRDAARAAVAARLAARADGATVPLNFAPTARAHDPSAPRRSTMPTDTPRNPQTEALMELLELDYKLDGPPPGTQQQPYHPHQHPLQQQWLQPPRAPPLPPPYHGGGAPWGGPGGRLPPPPPLPPPPSVNPEEIDLGDEEAAPNPEEVELPEE
jgi:hypothetical protein